MMRRRQFTHSLAALGALAGTASLLGGCASAASASTRAQAKVVVVGGGYGGATAAKYLRLWSDYGVDVTLVEPAPQFISCPMSNLVIGGSKTLADITLGYDALVRHHGVRWVRDRAVGIDAERRRLRLADGTELAYDRLILSPGVDFMWETLPGLASSAARERVLHAWKAGAQTQALRRQILGMPDGGVFAMTIPLAPYRCPPGPYERACQVADYLRQAKPRSKVLILDANDDVTSKGALFKKAWKDRYAGLLEYRPSHRLLDVDATTRTLKFELQDDLRADVLNVIPDMRAGDIAVQSGLATANRRWCEVDFLSFESLAMPGVHVLGDATLAAPAMPKSAHMTNQHAKTCAAAVLALLADRAPNPEPVYNNTCYSFVSAEAAVHVASVHRFDAQKKTMLPVAGAGGVSSVASELEGRYALAWARNIWADTLA